ncbi:unnamed protein product, partial [Owenia fusiformis]
TSAPCDAMMLWVFLALCAVAHARVTYEGYQVIEVHPRSVQDVDFVRQLGDNKQMKISFWKEPVRLNSIEFDVPPVSSMMVKQVLADNGIPFTIVWNDLQQRIDQTEAARISARFSADPSNQILSDYQRHDTINTWLDSMGSQYAMATVRSIGNSYEGRDMRAIRISSGSGRRSIVLDCGIHAREWITVSTCIYFIQTLLEQYNSDTNVRAMVDNYDFHILPVANPDGYEYSHTDDRMWRKTRSPTDDFLCTGTDANRNFDAFWGEAGVSFDPCAATYPGTGPFSEVETRNIRDWASGVSNKILYMNIHSYTQLWLVPWGYHPTTPYPDDYDELARVGELAMDALFTVNGRQFVVGTPPDLLYSVSGGALDWGKASGGFKYSYSPELRPASAAEGGFILPPEDILPAGRETFAALQSHCENME